MLKKRRFIRIRCKVKCSLEYRGHLYHCHLENVSINGALVRLHESMLARPGEACRLSVYSEEGKAPFKMKAEMVHIGFSMAGVTFLPMEQSSEYALQALLEKLSPEVYPRPISDQYMASDNSTATDLARPSLELSMETGGSFRN